MNTEKRLIIAIILSMAVVLIFQRFAPQPKPAALPQATVEKSEAEKSGKIAETRSVNTEIIQPAPLVELEKVIETKKETERFILTFSNQGGVLKSAFLKGYNTTIAKNLELDQTMFLIKNASFGYKINNILYSVEESKDSLTYFFTYPERAIKVIKKYSFSGNNDYVDLSVYIQNMADTSTEVSYSMVGPACIEPVSSLQGQTYIEANASIDGRVMRKSGVKASGEEFTGIIPWVALKNTYYTIALKTTPACDGIDIEQFRNKKLSITIENKPRALLPKSMIEDKYIMYLGPIDKKRLTAVHPGFGDIVNYGFFGPISVVLLGGLGMLNNFLHNWGLAIIALTILVNIVLFPLTKISFLSMQRMQEIQPHMENLRKLYKDNPQRLNKEIMELYKANNVNPFGGCLPMLLQLPIFFAFYQALIHSLELKNAKFLWIKDLSMPDALITFPQAYPFIGDKFNLLPIITLVLMVIQQKSAMASNANASPEMIQQQKIMLFMFPVLFGFILYNFPAGLVIYWFTNSLLMTIEQTMLKKTMPKITLVS